MTDETPRPPRTRDIAAILFASLFPTLVTWVYFVTLAKSEASLQQTAYSIGKTMQFSFPLLWVLLVQRHWPRWLWGSGRYVGLAVGFGALVSVGMVALYQVAAGSTNLLAGAETEIRAKVEGIGIHFLWQYVAAAVFYSLGHSLLEEYYYRWFIFGQMRAMLPLVPALILSSLAFMAHHVIVLAMYFGWSSPVTYLFSLCIATGGLVWAWIYEKSGSLIGPWLSHMLVDAAIFLVGYSIVGSLLQPSGG
ncbi:MAG: CPBP family intramembrane glutamic endopeptidase [Planctomycetota bacterium]